MSPFLMKVYIVTLLMLTFALSVASNSLPATKKPDAGFSLPVRRVTRSHSQLGLGKTLDVNSEISVANSNEFAYLVTVDIGSQNLSVLLDTGSSDLWTVSSDCTTNDCQGVTRYSKSSSSSFYSSNTPFELTYLIGSVSGTVATETITFGPFQISSQTFALANQTTKLDLSGTGNSGILGLAFPSVASISQTSGRTLFENIFSHFNESQQFFAFKLGRTSDGEKPDNSLSSFSIAQYDPTVTNNISEFRYINVSRSGADTYNYWKLPLRGMTVNSSPFPLSPSCIADAPNPVAVFDTGTTLILGPTVDVEVFWDGVGASRKNKDTKMWEVRCERAVNVAFIFGEDREERQYAVDPIDISWANGGTEDGWCTGGIQANDGVSSGDWLFGDVFLRNVYVSHHMATSSRPPNIGLLGMTDPISALASFRTQRGSDPSSSAITFRTRHHLNPASVCALVSTCGFLGGAITFIIARIWRHRICIRTRNRKGKISI